MIVSASGKNFCGALRFPGVALLLILAFAVAAADRAFATQPPLSSSPAHINFLFVYLDDQRYDAMQFIQEEEGAKARFPWLKTPNMDRLRAQSVWFRNAFATDSLCSPSRASFLTGQYPHVHGVTNNHEVLPPNTVTYATLLHAAGYATGFIGKWHMGRQTDRPGFDFSASFLSQGEYYNCAFLLNGGPKVFKSSKWTDEVSTDFAIDFLKKYKDRPFVLALAFKSVHGPHFPDAPEQHLYEGDKAGPTPNLNVSPTWRTAFDLKITPKITADVVPYFQCLTGADRELGRVLDALDSLGLSPNTMVIFASDNGYELGEHELGDKRTAYEESMRIPFMIRAPFIPNTAGEARDQMILNIDVAPTMLDYAGVPIPKTMQGRSLRPLLEHKDVAGWDRSFFYEYFFENKYLFPTMMAVRTDNAKLILYPGHPDWTEMFKIDKDPYETNNLAQNPEQSALRKNLETELNRLKDTTSYVVPGDSDQDTYARDAQRRAKGAARLAKQQQKQPPPGGNQAHEAPAESQPAE